MPTAAANTDPDSDASACTTQEEADLSLYEPSDEYEELWEYAGCFPWIDDMTRLCMHDDAMYGLPHDDAFDAYPS